MRLRKSDWESLRSAMPGAVITVPPPRGKDAVFSITWRAGGQWSLVRGSIVTREPDRVTERMEVLETGDALTISRHLEHMDALPLSAKESEATDFPTPRQLYWYWCVGQLPGELLETPDYKRSASFSLTHVRSSWKIHCVEEVDEDRLAGQDYFTAVMLEEMPDIRTIKTWEGRTIGDRNGTIRDDGIHDALLRIGADPDVVSLLNEHFDDDDNDPDDDDFIASCDKMMDILIGTSDERTIPVEVIALESPVQERIAARRYAR